MIFNPSQDSHVFKDDDMVCYCFEYTKKDIENDYLKHGRSSIFDKIAAEKQAGHCSCAVKNPKGV